MAAPGEADVPSGRKTFIPLGLHFSSIATELTPLKTRGAADIFPENNPQVFAHLVHCLGVSPTLGFYDIYSLSSPDLLSMIPRPAYALIFICPAAVYFRAREAENNAMQDYQGSGSKEPVIWFRQTIRHACGLMALLHSVSNGRAKDFIQTESDLDKLLKAAVPLQPAARADLLYHSKPIEAAHAAAAQLGDSRPPPGEEENGYHFISFVKADDGHLWELNGGMKGPVDRGPLEEGEDALSGRALKLGPLTFLETAGESEVEFSLVALAPCG